ncbi:MAG: glutamyl-tRNA reductase, partial [bacterium]|nr:glutamyl-tRNA reductase [bacterium]
MFRNIPEHFLVVTLNHRTVSIDQLYQFSIPEEWMHDLLLAFQSAPSIKEVAGLCTCNRTEFYAAVHSVKDAAHAIVHILSERLGVSLESMRQGMDVIVDAEAVEHLFRLAAGLESMVVGDAQILGQVKAAYQFSESLNLAGKIFHHLFPKAFSMAKRVRHQTGLGKGRVSVSALAVECARQFFVSTDTLVATVVGAGKMGRLSAKYLCDAGCKEIRIVNRSVDKSLQLAQEVGGIAYNFDEIATALAGSQLVISSTAAKSPIITK